MAVTKTLKMPDTVRAPDIAFVAATRLPAGELPEAYFPLTHGTRLVWAVDPRARTIHVRRRDGAEQLLRPGDGLGGEDVVPGCSLAVAELLG